MKRVFSTYKSERKVKRYDIIRQKFEFFCTCLKWWKINHMYDILHTDFRLVSMRKVRMKK